MTLKNPKTQSIETNYATADPLESVLKQVREQFFENRKKTRSQFWQLAEKESEAVQWHILQGVRSYAMRLMHFDEGGRFVGGSEEHVQKAFEMATDLFILESVTLSKIREGDDE